MKIVFKRVIMSEVLTTYLPTALLIIISYSTTFFGVEFFEANLTVNLSVMFVMTTLFVSVMEKLPQTSYIRMVDVWLIYGQLVPFVYVVLLTFKAACKKGEKKEELFSSKSDSSKDKNSMIAEDMKRVGEGLDQGLTDFQLPRGLNQVG